MAPSPQALATFGPGILMVTRIDIPNQTPINIGKAQEFSISLKGNTKELYGQNQLPDLAARGTVKATGKIKAARFSALASNAVFFGQNLTPGGFQWNIGEAASPATTTYQVTNHATFDKDLGVVYAASGQPLILVAAAPAQGQYAVNPATGTYTINVADENTPLLFTYTSTVTTGQTLTYVNQPIGTSPTFQLDYWNNVNQPTATPFACRIYSSLGSGFDLGFKLEDFGMPDFEFGMFCNAGGQLFSAVLPNVS